jgi:hypothetical protein
MKLVSKPLKTPREPDDPLERARAEALDVRDISRDDVRRLRDYDASEEESTARHEIPYPQPQAIHLHLDSIHESEPPAKKQLKAGLIALGSGLGIALLGGLAALLQRCGK